MKCGNFVEGRKLSKRWSQDFTSATTFLKAVAFKLKSDFSLLIFKQDLEPEGKAHSYAKDLAIAVFFLHLLNLCKIIVFVCANLKIHEFV